VVEEAVKIDGAIAPADAMLNPIEES